MPFPNYHSGRIKNPGLFARIRVLQTLPNGIMIYGGTLKTDPNGSSKAQSYRFPIDRFTADEAKEWLKEHDISYIRFEKATNEVNAFSASVNLLSQIFSFNQQEIISYIPEDVLAKIKEKNEHPFFTMYSICHEGVSEPVVIGEGSKKISWSKKAVQSIKNIITKGVKLFKGHNEDGSHAGRKVIGNIIHSFEKDIDGILHHLIIAYHKPEVVEEVKKFNVCSQEAFWNIINMAGNFVADTIDKLTGIALENSRNKSPAFPGARRLGFVQAFKSSGEDDKNPLGESGNILKGETNMSEQNIQTVETDQDLGGDPNLNLNQPNQGQKTQNNQPTNNFQNQNRIVSSGIKDKVWSYQELKAEIKRLGVYPHQIFDVEDIKRDKEFIIIFNEVEMLKEDLKKKEDKIINLARTAALSTAIKRIENTITENNVPPKVANFIKTRFEKGKESISDLTDDGIKKFVEDQTGLFQELAKEVYPEFDMKTVDSDKNAEPEDMTKAENNELLDEDLDI